MKRKIDKMIQKISAQRKDKSEAIELEQPNVEKYNLEDIDPAHRNLEDSEYHEDTFNIK